MKGLKRIAIWLLILLLVASTYYVLSPLFRKGFFLSDDGEWMIIRLSAFYQSFREGQFPVRFLGRLNYSFGYPVANFLYPGLLYLGSLLRVLGLNFVFSIKAILVGSVVIGALGTYMWLARSFKKIPSLVGTICFVLAPYLGFDLFTRGSVGEILAIGWAPWGLYSIAANKPWLFALIVSLLIVSHNTLALVFVGFYILYITLERKWRDFWLMGLLGMGMVMFFWVPALYEQKYVVFSSIAVSKPSDYFITFRNIFLLGIPGVLALGVSLWKNKMRPTIAFAFALSFIFVLVLVLPISGFIWNIDLFARMIQFPYRVLSLGMFLGSWLIAYALQYVKRWEMATALTVCLVGVSVYTAYQTVSSVRYTDKPEAYYVTNEATTTVHDEYMPIWAVNKPSQHVYPPVIFFQGHGTFDFKKLTTQTIDAAIHASEDSTIQVNMVYYPGWGASLDGAPVIVDYHNPQGLMRVSVPNGDHHLVMGFRETISRFVADIASFAAVVFYVIYVVILSHRRLTKKR